MTDEKDTAEPAGASGGSLAWIPVTERLPNRGSSVLCVNAEQRVYGQGWFSEGDYAIRWNEAVHVTHWMPLPALPASNKQPANHYLCGSA
jgi:hypothetical protein